MSRCIRSRAAALMFVALVLMAATMPRSIQAEEATMAKRVEVGDTAPDFTLADPDGKDHAASALRGEKNLLLVFFRGAW